MAGQLLTTQSRVLCPHGGQAILLTSNARVSALGLTLLQNDTHLVIGCPFTVGPDYSPCVTIEWSFGAFRVSVGGTPMLTNASIGVCKNPESVPQGLAVIVATQQSVSAT